MKLTVEQLKKIIREEVERNMLNESESAIMRAKNGKFYIIDDEGNRTPHSGHGYEYLEPGQSEPFEGPMGGSQHSSWYPSTPSYGRRRW